MMKKDQLECSSCGHILNLKDAVGVWIECPRCHSRFMINNIPPTGEMGGDEKSRKAYYFAQQCDFESFRNKCFDQMMQSSPADIFAELKVVEEKQCYLPYVSSIGGDSDSTYKAEYVGADKHDVIAQQYSHIAYKNNDKRFGTFGRSLDKGSSTLEDVHVDKALVVALPKWAAHADELHFYPFYCLVCNYKGTTFSFSSLGGDDIKTTKMPTDGKLRRGPYLIELSNSERLSYANKAALVVLALVALGLVWYFQQDLLAYYNEEKAYTIKHFNESYKFNGWFAYVVYTVYVAWQLLKALFFVFVGAAITYVASFCTLWLAIIVGVFLRNRYFVHCCLAKLRRTQQRKQHEAQALHNIHLNKLYDKEEDLY